MARSHPPDAKGGLGLADLDVQVITAPTVRLDLEADRRSLAACRTGVRRLIVENGLAV